MELEALVRAPRALADGYAIADGVLSFVPLLAALAARARRLAAADLVLFNEGLTLDQLAAQVQQIGRQFGL